MSSMSINEHINSLYGFAKEKGFPEELFFSSKNQEGYILTSIDAYRDYPLFERIFNEKYDEKTFMRMMDVDLKSRLGTLAGVTVSEGYESVMLLEPPLAKKTGMLQYVRAADLEDYTLLLKPAMYRLEDFEKFAHEKRKGYLDEATWYIYIFATKKEFQGRGHGKKLMNLIISYADTTGCRICLETNLPENVGMYEHFGFETADRVTYKDNMEHYVMIYTGRGGNGT